MSSLGKRTNFTDGIDGESHKRPRVDYAFINKSVIGNTYRRFQHLHKTTPLYDVFLTLCAYLHVLLSWDYVIPTSAFDAFIHAYSKYLQNLREVSEQQVHDLQIPAYHSWFQYEHVGRRGSAQDRNLSGGGRGDADGRAGTDGEDGAGLSSVDQGGGGDEALLSADLLREL